MNENWKNLATEARTIILCAFFGALVYSVTLRAIDAFIVVGTKATIIERTTVSPPSDTIRLEDE